MQCHGCGVKLQYTNKNEIGYSPKKEATLCQRCYRIIHYDDLTISLKQGIDSQTVIDKINRLDALIVWVVDLFDFEANMIKNFNEYLIGKDIIFVGTKRDLLPETLSNEKLTAFILKRLSTYKINVNAIVVTGGLHQVDSDNESIAILNNVISHYRFGRNICVVGMANAGKSSLLNRLLNNTHLTTSRYPGTTIDLVAIPYNDYLIYDTPGISKDDTILTHIDESLLKQIVPRQAIHPTVFQLKGNQTLSIGGLVKLDLIQCDKVSAVTYFKNELNIHRSKFENSENLWNTHLNTLLIPSLNSHFSEMKTQEWLLKPHKKYDIVIHGLGWICISGTIEKVIVSTHQNVAVSLREAML